MKQIKGHDLIPPFRMEYLIKKARQEERNRIEEAINKILEPYNIGIAINETDIIMTKDSIMERFLLAKTARRWI